MITEEGKMSIRVGAGETNWERKTSRLSGALKRERHRIWMAFVLLRGCEGEGIDPVHPEEG
jgi:hypothetical protein